MTYHVHGRRWFQKSYRNTYNSVIIIKDGEQIAYLPKEYGYENAYLQRAHVWLGKNGFPELAERHDNGSPKHNTTVFFREHNISYTVDDVARQKDL